MPVPSSSFLVAAAGKRALSADRDVGVLRHEQRFEAALLQRRRQLRDVDAVIDRKVEDADFHLMLRKIERC